MSSSTHSRADFSTAAEQQPGVVTVGVPGASTPQGIELQRLREEYGVEVTAVPFNGNAEMTTALLGGNVDAVLINASSDVTANIDGGQFRPLAVSSDNITLSAPRSTAVATSETSARVGSGMSVMLASICVATMVGLA